MLKKLVDTIKNSIKNNSDKYIPVRYHAVFYSVLLSYYKLISYFCFQQFSELKKFLSTIEIKHIITSDKVVYILQSTFYSRDSHKYLSGGPEKYLNDLAKLIISLGFVPIVIQQGDKFWYKKHSNIHVIGVASNDNFILFNKLAHHSNFGKPALRIYSPFTLAYPHNDPNSIGVSHGIFWDRPYAMAFTKIIEKSFNNIKKFISVDTATITWLRSSLPLQVINKEMRYIPNYVDMKQFSPMQLYSGNTVKILYPRAVSFERGYFLLEQIIPNLLSLFNDIEFHIVGIVANQDIQKSLDNLINNYPNNVFSYHNSAEQMPTAYQQADIIIIPTVISEGTSLSCLEAMATAKPIIATNVGGLSDLIIDGYNGLLISPDAIALQEAIIKLLSSVEMRKKLSNNALKVAECFDKNIWEIKWIEILRAHLIYKT